MKILRYIRITSRLRCATQPAIKMNFLYLPALVLYLIACNKPSDKNREQPTITIAVAANMQFAMDALIKAFEVGSDIQCQTTVSSSGKLTAQIMEGAPFDVFVSADMKYPLEIEKSGLAALPARPYAFGKLVLWTMKPDFLPDFSTLDSEQVRHIALANPRTAPYGSAAMEVLEHLGMQEKVMPKLVYGESIAQTNQFIITQAAELGFTAMSVVFSPEMKGKGAWIAVPSGWYSPIEQGAVVIKRGETSSAAAVQFFEYLFSEEAQQILKDYGYKAVETH